MLLKINNPLTVFLFVIASAFSANAQQKKSADTETKEMFFRITQVEKKGTDTVLAAIAGGTKYGLKKGSTGPVKGVYKNDDDRSDLELGFASVISIGDDKAVVKIRPVGNTSKQYEIREGDYVQLKIDVPKLPYRSILFQLALMDIQFYNLSKEPLYSFEDLLNRDSKKLEDSLMQAGAKDVFATYDALKDESGDRWDVLKKPLEQGRYAGRSIFNVMQFCTARDVYTFLNFVKSYPGKYIGNSWKLNETFATWVMNKAPLGKREVMDSVQAYKNKPQQLKQFLANNLKEIKDKAFVNDWLSDASEAADDGNLAEAQMLYESAKIMLPYLQEDCTTAYYYYTYTSYTDYKKDYQRTIKYIDTASMYFNKCGNAYFYVQTLLKKGLTYYNMDKSEEAIASFDAMYAEAEKQSAKLKPTQKTSFLAKYNHFTGILLAVKGELKIAAERYEKAIAYYQSLGNYSNLQSAIGVQGRLARLYKRQGELQKSLTIYNQQYALYSKLNDYKNIADVLDNIASIEFSLGNYRRAISNYEAAKYIYLQIPELNNAGFSQSNIGQAYWNLGKYDSAIAAHQLAISYRRQANSFSGLGYSWKKIGGLYKETGEKAKAFVAYDSASYYYTLAKDSANLKSLLSDIGDVYYNDKQYQKAFDYYQKWHNLNVDSKDKPSMANSGYQLADAANNFDVPLAKKLALSCLELSKSIGDKTNEYNAATLLGFIAFKNYDYDEGNKYFNQSLSIAILQKNKKQEASCYRFMGLAYSNKLDFENAQKYLRRSIAISDSLGDKTVLPYTYRYLGNSIQSKGDFYEARKQYQKAIDAAYAINSRADVGYGYSALTFLYIIQGELSKAEQVTDSTYAIFQGLNNSWQMAEAYFNKGLVYEAKNDGINAVKYYSMADSIYQQEKDMYSQSTCKTNIACVFYYQADFDKALDYFFQADKMLATIKVTTEAHILSPINLGETYYYKKDFAKAEPYLIKGYQMAIDKKAGRMQTIAASFLGTLYYDLKKYDLSEKYLLEGFALAQKSNETDLYINSGMYLGKLYASLNQPQKSQEYFGKTVAFIKTIDNSKYTWMALYEYGLSLYNNKQLDSAVVYFKKAVEIVENSAQKLFGGAEAKKIYNADERKVDLYNKLVASLAKLGKKEDALYYADKTNNQAVKEQMEKAGLVTNDKEKEEALKKGGELLQKKNAVDQAIAKEKAKPEKEQNKQLIASLETVKNVAETDYTNFIEGLQRKYPDLQAYFSNTNPKDFKNYIEDIPDSTLVALYVVNDNQLLIFTVTNKETGIKTIELKQDINKQAAHFLSVLRNPKNATGTGAVTLRSTLKPVDDVRGDFKSEATDLYNLLITPLADQLKDKKNLCIITNGKLGSIPFQCLGAVDDKKEFHFLVEDKAIFYTSKIDIFRKAYKNRPMQSSLSVLGNPDKSLPGATEEAKEIGKIVPTATVYIEEQATESKAIEGLQKFNYVHFATHGVLDYNNFEDSYLLFAKDANGNDGKLTIKEINGLTKQTNSLVVLSACETAVSKEEVKGWYISPANAFLTNRCDAVLATFWKVPDETTNLLLQEFYKNISKGMTKVEALRHAQAAVSQNPKYSHPFYWAAFLLNGEWR